MELYVFILICLILIVTAITLNENIKINRFLNNLVTRTLILFLVIYFGTKKDITFSLALAILFVVLSNDSLNKEKFQAGSMTIDLTGYPDDKICKTKCVSGSEDDSDCNDLCSQECYKNCSTKDQNLLWADCLSMCV